MSTIVGGPHKCSIHPDFPETDNEEEWTRHLVESEGHSTTGAFPCEVCGAEIRVENIPIQPDNKVAKLKCPDCYGKQEDLQRMVLNSVQQQQGEEVNQNA